MFFFFKQKTAYELRISDWSSDVCSSDLIAMSWELNLNQREKKDIDTASCHRSRPPDGGRPCRCRCRLPLRRQDHIWGRFRLVRGRLAGQGDQAVRVGRDLRPTALGERLCQYAACRKSS